MNEIIRQDMMELGMRFAGMAKEAKSAREAKTAFDMAVKAYALAMQTSPEIIPDFNLLFIATVKHGDDRSEAWTRYVAYCARNGCSPITKGALFAMMGRMGFVSRKSHGVHRLYLDGKIAPELRAAQKQLLAEFESGQKLIEDETPQCELLEI